MRSKKVNKPHSLKDAIDKGDLGQYLRIARENAGLSQGDVAKILKLSQFQSISQWERNASGSVPVKTLLKLVKIYDLPVDEVYEVLHKFHAHKLETNLKKKFYGTEKKVGS